MGTQCLYWRNWTAFPNAQTHVRRCSSSFGQLYRQQQSHPPSRLYKHCLVCQAHIVLCRPASAFPDCSISALPSRTRSADLSAVARQAKKAWRLARELCTQRPHRPRPGTWRSDTSSMCLSRTPMVAGKRHGVQNILWDVAGSGSGQHIHPGVAR